MATVIKALKYEANKNLKSLKAFVELRKRQEPLVYANLYIDILYQIDELLLN